MKELVLNPEERLRLVGVLDAQTGQRSVTSVCSDIKKKIKLTDEDKEQISLTGTLFCDKCSQPTLIKWDEDAVKQINSTFQLENEEVRALLKIMDRDTGFQHFRPSDEEWLPGIIAQLSK